MAVQMQSAPSYASVMSVLSIVFYCVGFFQVQLVLNDQNRRISALESVAVSSKPPSNDQIIKLIKDAAVEFAIGDIQDLFNGSVSKQTLKI